MRRMLIGQLVVVVVGLALPSVAAGQSVAITSLEEGKPARGFTTGSVTASVGACPARPPGEFLPLCWRWLEVRVQPAAQGCTSHDVGELVDFAEFTSAGGTLTRPLFFKPAVEGDNRLCGYVISDESVVAATELVWNSPTGPYPSGDVLNCANFPSQRAAQAEFNKWRPGDPHNLDADSDGIACEENGPPYYYGSEWPLPAEQPPPSATPEPLPPASAPTLTFGEGKRRIKTALRQRFGAAYRASYAKRIVGCERRSDVRVSCRRVSWVVGDLSYKGRVTIWLSQGEAVSWHSAYAITRTNEYCASQKRQGVARYKHKRCTRTFRGAS